MEREIKKIKLSNCEVGIVSFLTWGEKEEGTLENVGASMASLGSSGGAELTGNPLLELKYRRLEIAVKEIDCNGEKIKFSRDWMNNLGESDGDRLYSEVEALFSKKK